MLRTCPSLTIFSLIAIGFFIWFAKSKPGMKVKGGAMVADVDGVRVGHFFLTDDLKARAEQGSKPRKRKTHGKRGEARGARGRFLGEKKGGRHQI